MNEITDWSLLARYLSGECSPEEREKVEAWIASDPENQRLAEFMKVAWNTPEPQPQTSDVERLWSEVAEKAGIAVKAGDQKTPETPEPASRTIKWDFDLQPTAFRILRYAAVVLVATSLVYFFSKGIISFPWGQQISELKTITVERGDRQRITLSDGTNIALDAGSILSYPEEFKGDTREVFLNGEGYFEVASNVEKPFIVHANHAVVQVLGTKFNVRAWQPNKRVTVAVAEGKVSLRSEEGADREAVVINRDQSSTLPEDGLPSLPHPVDIKKHLGWIHNEVSFENAPLYEILYQLERWFDVQFVLADSSVAEERLTLHIQNKPLEDILELINALTDLDDKHTGKLVRLKPRDVNER
jgi:ferric-dicitrate binding protein FerR (iron transport regulator)